MPMQPVRNTTMCAKKLADKGVPALLVEFEEKYRKSARNWRLGYRGLLVFSALFSTAAAVVGKLEYVTLGKVSSADIASICAGITAVITTVIAALDFEVNWRVNRGSRHEVSAIVLEAKKSTANDDALLSNLQDVVRRRNEAFNRHDNTSQS
jgi:hypothetical protein